MLQRELEERVNGLLETWKELCISRAAPKDIESAAKEFYKELLGLPPDYQSLFVQLTLDPTVRRGAEHVAKFMQLLKATGERENDYILHILVPRGPSFEGVSESHGSSVRGRHFSHGNIESIRLANDPEYELVDGIIATPHRMGHLASDSDQPRCRIFARENTSIKIAAPGSIPDYLKADEVEWVRRFYEKNFGKQI